MNAAVLIPALNAAASLPVLLERTLNFVSRDRIFIINDGSLDATKSAAEQFGVNVISHERNRGKGAALQTGFDAVLSGGFPAVITMDADLQHRPEEIPNFITFHSLTRNDVIIGSRLHNTMQMPFHRILSNTMTSVLVRMRTGAAISDSQSGFRFIMRNVLEQVRLEANGFEAETEFLIKAAARGFTFGSIPIDAIYAGERSHMTHVQTTVNFIKVLLKQY